MSDDKQLVRKVYEGDVISPVGDLRVEFTAQPGTFNEAVERLRQALDALKVATRQLFYPDEKDIIDQE